MYIYIGVSRTRMVTSCKKRQPGDTPCCNMAYRLVVFFYTMLMAYSFDAFGSPHEVVKERANQGNKDDDQRPHQFVIAFRRLFCETVYQRVEPEDSDEDSNAI